MQNGAQPVSLIVHQIVSMALVRLILGNAHVRKERMELSVIKTVHQVVLELVTKSLGNVILVLQDCMGTRVQCLVVLDVKLVSVTKTLGSVLMAAKFPFTQVKSVRCVLITVLNVMIKDVLNANEAIMEMCVTYHALLTASMAVTKSMELVLAVDQTVPCVAMILAAPHVRMVSGVLNVNYPAVKDALMEHAARMMVAVHAEITGTGIDVTLVWLEDMVLIVT